VLAVRRLPCCPECMAHAKLSCSPLCRVKLQCSMLLLLCCAAQCSTGMAAHLLDGLRHVQEGGCRTQRVCGYCVSSAVVLERCHELVLQG
jgi:hypothetical protein